MVLFANGCTGNRGLLTAQALLVSQASLGTQAFEASCAKRSCYQTVALLPELDTLESC